MIWRYFTPAGRLARAQKKIARGNYDDATRMLVGMLNKGVDTALKPAVFLALAEAETGCGNLGNAGYYARQCEEALEGDEAADEETRSVIAERLRKLHEAPA